MRVKVDVGARVALGGEVRSEEGSLVLVELLRCGVDGYDPEILLVSCTRDTAFGLLIFDIGKVGHHAELIQTKSSFTWVSTHVV